MTSNSIFVLLTTNVVRRVLVKLTMNRLLNLTSVIAMITMLGVLPGMSLVNGQRQNVMQSEVEQNDDARSRPAAPGQIDSGVRVSAKGIDSLIASQSSGRVAKELVRVFAANALIDSSDIASRFVPKAGRYFPESRTLVVTGYLDGNRTLEDIHFLDFEDSIIVARDFYLDGDGADLAIGRGLPFQVNGESIAGDSVSLLALATPVITSISGYTSSSAGITNGRVDMSCGSNYNGNYAINDQPGTYRLTINGSNFGSGRGTVTLAGYNAPISSWSNTSIVIDPTVPWYQAPVCAVLRITTAAGSVLNSGINMVAAIRTRIYGQCTYQVALTRLQMGMTPSPYAYDGYSTINGSYSPRAGDQYQWTLSTGKHAAIVAGVSGPVLSSGGIKTWTLTINQQNADCRNTVNRYTTTFKTQTIGSSTTVTAYPKSCLGASCTAYSCTLYYR